MTKPTRATPWADFLAYLRLVARVCPEGELHLVPDSGPSHLMNQVKTWFGILTRQKTPIHGRDPRGPIGPGLTSFRATAMRGEQALVTAQAKATRTR